MKRDSSISRVALLAVFTAVSAALMAQDAAPVSVVKPPAGPVPGDATAAGAKAPTDLIPAAFGIWTDRAGSSWSVEAAGNIGRIGSSMVNGGLALLVNEEKFSPYQPMMTPDGKEMVIQGLPLESIPGLQMQRRVRLLGESGGLRYAELFHNGSADPMTLSIGLATNFSGNFKTFLSDRGRSEPRLLTPAEAGVVVLPGSSQSSRAFLFTLAGGAVDVRDLRKIVEVVEEDVTEPGDGRFDVAGKRQVEKDQRAIRPARNRGGDGAGGNHGAGCGS